LNSFLSDFFYFLREGIGLTHIDDIKAGVAIVILDDQKRVLLQKRAEVGLWGIPSGHIEVGETVASAAIREDKE
jgi:8-oxo-dGTP pyrophosphatase MutT (NUDIX family)